MAKPTQIRQGGNLTLTYDRDGESIVGYTCDVYIKQYDLDTATVKKLNIDVDPSNPSQWTANIKPSESALLNPGLWYAFSNIIKTSSSDEEARQVAGRTIRFQVAGSILPPIFVLLQEGTENKILLQEGGSLLLQESP